MLALVVVTAVLAAQTSAPASPASPASQASLSADPVVEALVAPDDVKGLRATFRVHAPADVVLETLWDVRKFRSIFPDIQALAVLRATDNQVDAKFIVDAVLATVTYTLRRDVDKTARTVVWKNIAGDLKIVRGGWTVKALDDESSEVIYTRFVDVGTFVPTGMVRDIAMGKVKEMAKRVRAACVAAVAPGAKSAPQVTGATSAPSGPPAGVAQETNTAPRTPTPGAP